ncbi:MAG TPA: aldo/keto reductase [Bryobacteraceae bacterium]|nr:aldo/keto reductase [Bryobacteraceae bacterium]
MRTRTLGRTGLAVSEIGFGAWGIGGKQWMNGSDEESLQALRRAIGLGINFIDTAFAYNEGHSERLIAQVVKETGAPVTVATKIPPKNRIWPAQKGIPLGEVFPYDYIVDMTEQSLRNLGTDCIDLQQFHVWNPEWLEGEDWRRGIEDLKKAGKVRYFGISINDHQPDSALTAIATGLIDTVQVIYNIYEQSPERNLFRACKEHNIGVLARCPLDEGALTGAVTAESTFEPGEFRDFYFRGDRKAQAEKAFRALQADLAQSGEPVSTTALRFTLSNDLVSTVIPGMRKIRNVEANAAVSEAGALPADTLAILRRHAWSKCFYQ